MRVKAYEPPPPYISTDETLEAFGHVDPIRATDAEICDAVNAEGGAYGPRREFLRIYSTRTKMPLFYDFQTAQ